MRFRFHWNFYMFPHHAHHASLPPPHTTDHDDSIDMDRASITSLFTDAALYRQALKDGPTAVEPMGKAVLAQRSMHDLADLVGDDLDVQEKDVVGRFAQLAVEDDWDLSQEDSQQLVEEPDALSDDSASVYSDEDPTPLPGHLSGANLLVQEEKSVSLAPEEVVDLLVEEFGALAPKGEEELVVEADGAVVQDVVILGVIHVTTHRIAFHASMPPTDSKGSDSVLKSGPALVHRKGLHRKRRVWMELSRDFISTFPSAREEDRIRPLRSVMLTSIVKVLPEDRKHPRAIRVVLDGKNDLKEGHVEFDTVESAREWRRELQAALFFCRRRMHRLLSHPGSEDIDGVRIGIPLHRIRGHSTKKLMAAISILSLTVNSSRTPDESEVQVIQLGSFKFGECLDKLDTLIRGARRDMADHDAAFRDQPVVVDFGFGEPVSPTRDSFTSRSNEQVICEHLGINFSPDVWVTRAALASGLACTGFLVISTEWIGFWSKSLALRDVQYRLASTTIRSVTATEFPIRGIPWYGMSLDVEGQASLRFQFRSESIRDEAVRRITVVSEAASARSSASSATSASFSPTSTMIDHSNTSHPVPTSPGHRTVRRSQSAILAPLSRTMSHTRRKIDPRKVLEFPKVLNIPTAQCIGMPSKHFVCLTIGSRGDVQPYIALGLGLKKQGHRVTIVTHEEYKPWIEGFGLQYRAAGGDPGALMKLSVENKMFSPQFFKTSLGNYRAWLDQLLHDAWESCLDAEVLLESPYAMAGVHIAEALHIPYFRVCTMPWSKTTQFPHPFISPPVETPTFNAISYPLFDNIFWSATSGQINRWRRETLHLESTVMGHTAQSKIPILYNFSSAVVPKPLDWSDAKIICGYWFLDNPDLDWTPPESLLAFIKHAKDDGKPLVYIGFGSITVPDPHTMTENIFQAVQKSGVRAIVSRGWSSRMSTKAEPEVEVPAECYMIDKVPHDWLFPQVDAALHHGGAGTTSASLRAGIPTLIKPWFGDQYFWASRVQRLGAGLRVPSLRVADLTTALKKATTDRIIKEKAGMVGQRIRSEDGVQTAIHYIYTYFPRAYSEGLSPE